MNFLLVMPSGISRSQDQYFYVFSLGLAYISASLKAGGFNVVTANLDFVEGNTDTYSVMEQLITKNNIDVLCTGGLSRDYIKIKELIDVARRIKPDIVAVVGGGIISADPQPAMRVLGADIGVIGEGEETICELALALENGLSYESVSGLIYRNNDELIVTPIRKPLVSIDDIPFPDFDGFDYDKFVSSSGLAVIASSRSCTHACTFCFRPLGQKFRQRSLENIFSEIDFQIEHYNPKFFSITDNLFASSKQRVLDFCEEIGKRKVSWGCSLHVADVTDMDMLLEMKSSGCFSINYGLESADNSVLKSMRKGSTVKQIEHALENIWNAGIHLQANFIFGDINETSESLENTLEFVEKYRSRFLFCLDPIVAFPGSRLYEHACMNGLIHDREKFLKDNCPVINLSRLSESEFIAMLGLINEMRLAPRVPNGHLRLLDIKSDGQCSVECICRRCGTPEVVNLAFWHSLDPICGFCGSVNHLDSLDISPCSVVSLLEYFPANLVTVLWGAGGICYKLLNKWDVFSGENFFIVDTNESRQGQSMSGKEIYSPNFITQKNIKAVIITAINRMEEIHSHVLCQFPTVEYVFVPSFDIDDRGIFPVIRPL